MNIERTHSGLTPRHRVWCLMEDLLPAPGSDGAYTFAAQDVVSAIGDGSEIIVMDKPGLTMYWSSKTSRAYNWAGYDIDDIGSSGAIKMLNGKIYEYRGLLSDIQRVQNTSGTTAKPWRIVNSALAAKLANGCVILIMDEPDLMLFWSSTNQLAYSWESQSLLSSRSS